MKEKIHTVQMRMWYGCRWDADADADADADGMQMWMGCRCRFRSRWDADVDGMQMLRMWMSEKKKRKNTYLLVDADVHAAPVKDGGGRRWGG